MEKREFLKRIFTVDIDSGFEVQDVCEKALHDPEYADMISFSEAYLHFDTASAGLLGLCCWRVTGIEIEYWHRLHYQLRKAGL